MAIEVEENAIKLTHSGGATGCQGETPPLNDSPNSGN